MDYRHKLYILLLIFVFIFGSIIFVGQKMQNYDFAQDVEFLKERIFYNNNDVYSNLYPTEKARRNARRISDLNEIANFIYIFKKDTGDFPHDLTVNGSLTQTGIFSINAELNPLVPEYTSVTYKDPLNNSICNYTYIYNDKNFVLFSHMEADKDNINNNQYYCFDSFSRNLIIVDRNPSFNFRCE